VRNLSALCARWQASRDEAALSSLMALAMPTVVYHAKRWHRWCLPYVGLEDLVQAGREGVWRFAETYRGNDGLAGTALKRRVIDAVRQASRARRVAREDLVYPDSGGLAWNAHPDPAPSPREAMETSEAGFTAERLLDRLTPGQARYARRILEGRSKTQIAAEFGVSLACVSQQLKRAATKLTQIP
jgi:RNA polymerase sigma factor (sigma-70 family)